jgi:hypothetical protein
MNGTAFDGISRNLVQGSTRRGFLRLLGGAAAAGTIAAVGLGETTRAKKKKPGKVTICYQGQTRRVAKRGWQNQYPGATLGQCQAQPAVCTSWIISGGPDRTTPILVDDDLSITVNGKAIVSDGNKMAENIPAVTFPANVGDQIAVTAFDDNPACRSISPLWLHCATTGQKKQLSAGQNDGCVKSGRTAGTFFSQVFTVGL